MLQSDSKSSAPTGSISIFFGLLASCTAQPCYNMQLMKDWTSEPYTIDLGYSETMRQTRLLFSRDVIYCTDVATTRAATERESTTSKNVISIWPWYGPVAGGTRVTITGQLLTMVTVRAVQFGLNRSPPTPTTDRFHCFTSHIVKCRLFCEIVSLANANSNRLIGLPLYNGSKHEYNCKATDRRVVKSSAFGKHDITYSFIILAIIFRTTLCWYACN